VSMLRTQMRSIDTLGRVGGEEFVVVLPGLQEAAAVQAAERLRALVSNTPLAAATEQVAMSISIGVAQWDGHPEETTRLLMRADAALYKAKQGGRDRVALASVAVSVASG
jgi:diguanylate cyclase (GGDEF)-like protein